MQLAMEMDYRQQYQLLYHLVLPVLESHILILVGIPDLALFIELGTDQLLIQAIVARGREITDHKQEA